MSFPSAPPFISQWPFPPSFLALTFAAPHSRIFDDPPFLLHVRIGQVRFPFPPHSSLLVNIGILPATATAEVYPPVTFQTPPLVNINFLPRLCPLPSLPFPPSPVILRKTPRSTSITILSPPPLFSNPHLLLNSPPSPPYPASSPFLSFFPRRSLNHLPLPCRTCPLIPPARHLKVPARFISCTSLTQRPPPPPPTPFPLYPHSEPTRRKCPFLEFLLSHIPS